MRRIKLKISYIGTAYCGWQVQPGQDTVQKRVQDAIRSLTGEQVSVQGSGRTDSGVHALGQVAHFDTNSALPVKNFVSGLNHFLPPDIRIEEAKEVGENFHARFSAREKTYCYCIFESEFGGALYHERALRVKEKLDVKKMQAAAEALVGEHDFTSFMSTGSEVTSAVRTVSRIRVFRSGGLVKIYVTANGFLYNMVRMIAGVLIRAGKGEMDREGVTKLLETKSKDAVREVVAPYGLYLVSVKY